MDLADLLDMEFDWGQVDILSNVNPSFLNNPGYDPQQDNESVGTVAATPNQPHQNNTEYTFDYPGEATSSFSGNVNPSELVVDDPYELPQLPQNSLTPPLLDETQSGYYVPSMEELIPEGAGSSVQGQGEILGLMDIYNHFSLMQQNNNLPMMNDMVQQNEHIANNDQMLMPDIIANQNFNGMISNQQQPSTYPDIFQQNPVETGAGSETTGEHFMTDQTPPFSGLDNHAINPHSGWNSSPGSLWMQNQGNEYNPLLELDNPGFQQQTSTFNDPSAVLNSSFVATSSALNSAMLGLSGSSPNEGSNSQLFSMEAPQMASLFRSESAPGVQLQQVPPISNSVNTITPLGADNGLPVSPSFGAQAQPPSVPNLNVLNQNVGRSRTVTSSYGPYSTLLQNPPSLNTYERRKAPRRGRPRKHFEPSSMTTPYKRRKPKGSSSSAKEKAGKASASKANNADAAAAPGEVVEAPMYSLAFEKAGAPRDPLIRLFKLASAAQKLAGPATSK